MAPTVPMMLESVLWEEAAPRGERSSRTPRAPLASRADRDEPASRDEREVRDEEDPRCERSPGREEPLPCERVRDDRPSLREVFAPPSSRLRE